MSKAGEATELPQVSLNTSSTDSKIITVFDNMREKLLDESLYAHTKKFFLHVQCLEVTLLIEQGY